MNEGDIIPKEYRPYIMFLQNFEDLKYKQVSVELLNNIRVKEKGNMFLYKYSDAVIVPRNDLMLVKARGLVLRHDGVVLCYPFDRFFNQWEKEHAEIDWSTAIAQEKLDGSLINVFWTGKEWEITTRGSFYPNENTYENSQDGSINYTQEFKRLFKSFDLLDKDKCYMFELISFNNRIVTKYDWERVVLIGARNILTLKELSQKWLNEFAMIIGVQRPKQFPVQNIEECKKLFEGMREDEEGLVIVDDQFNRIKLKQESYLKLSKIKSLNEDELFSYIKGDLELDVEFIHAFPEVEEKINELMIKWEEYKQTLEVLFNKFKLLLDVSRKEFALQVVQYPKYKSALFAMADGKVYKDFVGVDML
jgi:hypothetical protein